MNDPREEVHSEDSQDVTVFAQPHVASADTQQFVQNHLEED